jgi:hypothetical protein
MNARTVLGAIGFAGSLAALTLPAGAQTPYTIAVPVGSQYLSNMNLERIADRIQRQIAFLNHDDRDYGGHRVNAIRDLRAAHDQLKAAEAYAMSHGYGTSGANPGPVGGPRPGGWRRWEWQSDSNLATVRAHLQQMIARLQRDSRDYGGHRVAAVTDMQAAVNELGFALQYAQAHPRV